MSWEGTWREVTGLAKNASFEIREQAGHSLKSAIKVNNLLYLSDKRLTYYLQVRSFGRDVRSKLIMNTKDMCQVEIN